VPAHPGLLNLCTLLSLPLPRPLPLPRGAAVLLEQLWVSPVAAR